LLHDSFAGQTCWRDSTPTSDVAIATLAELRLMAEAAKTQEPSMEELRARIRRIIAEDDDKPAERRTESASPKSDTTAPPPTQALYSAMPSPGRAQRLDPGSNASSDDQVSATAISDCSSALLNAAAAIASPIPQSTGTDPTPTAASASGLYARESGSAPLFDYGGKQVPMPSSMLHAAPAEKEEQDERLLGHAGEQVPVPSPLPDAAPGGKERQEPAGEQVPMPSHVSDAVHGREQREESRFGHAGQQLAMSSHGPQSAPAPDGADWDQLISRETNNAVHSAFNALSQTALLHNARTLEDMVREMLRPILKVWLDDNLPGIVEGLVRAEIERARRPARGDPGAR
jgi:cell pole-organizing protein PopZ